MEDDSRSSDLKALTAETQAIWEQNAGFWDDYVGEGNEFQRVLLVPATERLLQIRPGETLLDVGCGNGSFARQAAGRGAQVVACDFSRTFLERARERTTEWSDRIEYRWIDATDEVQLLTLGEARFDAAVANMVLMDMPTIDPLTFALARLLKPGGRFVFCVSHPCFHNTGSSRVIEQVEQDGIIETTYSVKVSRYLGLKAQRGLGIPGQPVPHYYFDRPLSVLFSSCFRAGFMLDGVEEPTFEAKGEEVGAFDWANFRETPPTMVARMRLVT